jgi:hypothetical protein
MKQIKPENLEKITTREKVLASAIDAVSAIGSKGDRAKPGTKVEALVTQRAENRSGGMGGKRLGQNRQVLTLYPFQAPGFKMAN